MARGRHASCRDAGSGNKHRASRKRRLGAHHDFLMCAFGSTRQNCSENTASALLTAVPYEAERKGGRQDSQRVNGGRTYCTDGGEKKGALDPTWNSCRAGSGQGQLFKRPGYVLKQPTHQFSSAAQGRRGQVSRLDVFTNRGGEKRGKQTGKQRTQLFLQLFRRRSQASRRHTKRRS